MTLRKFLMVDILIESVCLRLSVHYIYIYVTSIPSDWILVKNFYTFRNEYFFSTRIF